MIKQPVKKIRQSSYIVIMVSEVYNDHDVKFKAFSMWDLDRKIQKVKTKYKYRSVKGIYKKIR